jgi:unsaturated rhamnogalacturonyl hydrolase
MKIKFLILVLLFNTEGVVNAQKLPKKKDILAKMTLANAYFMKKWPDPTKTIITERERPSNIWTRATYYEGLLELYKIDPKQAYMDYTLQWGNFHKWNLRNGTKTRNADDQCCGQVYIDMYHKYKKPEFLTYIKANIDTILSDTRNDHWSWIDCLHMAMPVMARLGVLYNDNRYFEKMYDIYHFSKTQHGGNGLYNPIEKLWWRDKDFVPPYKEPNAEDCYWSRGNGWVIAAMVRVLEVMPQNAPHQEEYLTMYKDMIEVLTPLQRADGFWNVSLHDASHFGGKELTGTAFFTYSMAWGIRKGILDNKKYMPIVAKAWKGMAESVHPNGFLGYVQGTGKEPKDGQPTGYHNIPNFEDFGLGAFLLAGSEVYHLSNRNFR